MKLIWSTFAGLGKVHQLAILVESEEVNRLSSSVCSVSGGRKRGIHYADIVDQLFVAGEVIVARAQRVHSFQPLSSDNQGIIGEVYITNFKLSFQTIKFPHYRKDHRDSIKGMPTAYLTFLPVTPRRVTVLVSIGFEGNQRGCLSCSATVARVGWWVVLLLWRSCSSL